MDAAYVNKAKWWLYTGGRASRPKLISQILKGQERQTDEPQIPSANHPTRARSCKNATRLKLRQQNKQTIDHLAIRSGFVCETNKHRKTRMLTRARIKNSRRDNSLAKGNRRADQGNWSRWLGLRYR
jgi:hypothetical protein